MLPQIIENMTETIKGISIDKMTVIDNGSADSNSGAYSKIINQIPGSIIQLSETIKTATGVDVLQAMSNKTDAEIVEAE